MEDLQTKKISCPSCSLSIDYWTKSEFINCPKCLNTIKVEPCTDIVEFEEEISENTEIVEVQI